MVLNNYRNNVMDICKYKGWNNSSVETVWLLLIEEIGELAGSIRRNNNCFRDKKRVKIEDELGDVFSYLFQLSGMLDIDLDKMWETNQKKSLNKVYNGYNKSKDYKTQYKNVTGDNHERPCLQSKMRPQKDTAYHMRYSD